MTLLSRRCFLWLTAASVAARTARAESGQPEFWIGHVVKPGPGTTKFRAPYDKFAAAQLDRRIIPKRVDLVPTNNANTEFQVWVVFPEFGESEAFLGLDGAWWGSDSIDHGYRSERNTPDGTECLALFFLDRKTAKRVADGFKTPLYERVRLDSSLRATWTFPSRVSARSRDPILIGMRLQNAGKTRLYMPPGGHGPHGDGRFSFKIARNGQPVAPPIDAEYGRSGPIVYTELAPGQAADFSSDLRTRTDWTVPGRYVIDAQFGTVLSGTDGTILTRGPGPTFADRANVCDARFSNRGTIVVD